MQLKMKISTKKRILVNLLKLSIVTNNDDMLMYSIFKMPTSAPSLLYVCISIYYFWGFILHTDFVTFKLLSIYCGMGLSEYEREEKLINAFFLFIECGLKFEWKRWMERTKENIL